jgi:acetyltransferase
MGGGMVREGIEILKQAGIPTYNTPKNAVHAFMHLTSYARNRETLRETPRDVPVAYPVDRHEQKSAMISAAMAGKKETLSEHAFQTGILSAYGIQTTEPLMAQTADEAVELAQPDRISRRPQNRFAADFPPE